MCFEKRAIFGAYCILKYLYCVFENSDNFFGEKKSTFQPQPHCARDITDDDNEEVEVVSLFSLS